MASCVVVMRADGRPVLCNPQKLWWAISLTSKMLIHHCSMTIFRWKWWEVCVCFIDISNMEMKDPQIKDPPPAPLHSLHHLYWHCAWCSSSVKFDIVPFLFRYFCAITTTFGCCGLNIGLYKLNFLSGRRRTRYQSGGVWRHVGTVEQCTYERIKSSWLKRIIFMLRYSFIQIKPIYFPNIMWKRRMDRWCVSTLSTEYLHKATSCL